MAILSGGKPTNEKCPKCGGTIEYNGNYFCQHWNDTCDWALPHPQTELVDKQIQFRLTGYWEKGEAIINGEPRWITHQEEPK